MTVSSKVRIYDLAKELKLDTKRLIEEVRREGVDVSVPSNSVSKELAEKIRNKYFPKKETAVKRAVKVVKRVARPVEETVPVEEPPPAEPEVEPVVAEPVQPPIQVPVAPKPIAARLIKKLTPAARAEQPTIVEDGGGVSVLPEPEVPSSEVPPPPVEVEPPVVQAAPEISTSAPTPSRQVRVLRPTAAALNAGIRPGERAPAPAPPPSITPRERAERSTGRLRERPSL